MVKVVFDDFRSSESEETSNPPFSATRRSFAIKLGLGCRKFAKLSMSQKIIPIGAPEPYFLAVTLK